MNSKDLRDFHFTDIDIEDFLNQKALGLDVYIKLNTDRYVKIFLEGDSISTERVEFYKNDKKVKKFYLMNGDRGKYLKFCYSLANKTMTDDAVSSEFKTNLLMSISEKFMEDVYFKGLQREMVEEGKQICKQIHNFITTQKDLYKTLIRLNEFDPSAFSHSYLVTIFSAATIMKFESYSRQLLENTALACMFHDVGKSQLPKEMVTLLPDELNQADLERYKQHPGLGADLVATKPLIHSLVTLIIRQHHEYVDGSGFPQGLTGKNIIIQGNIVCLVNDFVHLMVDEGINPIGAMRKLLSDEKNILRYLPDVIEKFIRVFVSHHEFTNPENTTLSKLLNWKESRFETGEKI